MPSGLKVIAETEGSGLQAEKGDAVGFDCAASLNKGKVPPNAVLVYELWLTSVQKRARAK
jgi:FKBP-type peptidyl-prolyl cis-trans isomerase